MSLFAFTDVRPLGTVVSVDTGTVVVQATTPEDLHRVQVNQLVALRSVKAGHHHVGIVTALRRRQGKARSSGKKEGEDPFSPDDDTENIAQITLVGTFRDRLGQRSSVFRRTLESVPEIDALCFIIEGEQLKGFMRSVTASAEGASPALKIGQYTLDDSAEALLDGNKLFQRHAVIVGSTGSGKSWTVATVVEQIARLPSANIILFDLHGEYAPIAGPGIQHLRVAGPGDFSVPDHPPPGNVLLVPYWLLSYDEIVALLLDRSDQNAPNQAMVFAREILEAKRNHLKRNGDSAVQANFTVDSPIPYDLDQVISRLEELDVEMVRGSKGEKQGPFHGKLSRFIQRLDAKRMDRRLSFMFGAPKTSHEADWLTKFCNRLMAPSSVNGEGGVRIIDFSEVPSDVLPLVLGLVARLVFSVQQWSPLGTRHPVALLCDEAHLYMAEHASADPVLAVAESAFERIAKEGRKYGLGLVVISQRPSEVNRTVLSQCNNFIAMRLTNVDDQNVIRRLLPDNLGGLSDLLPILDTGEAVVVGDACMLPSRVRVRPPEMKPSSATVNFWDLWSSPQANVGVAAGVDSLRRQTRVASSY